MLATAAVVAGLVLWAIPSSPPGVEVLLPTPTPTPALKVFVTGAVTSPGVYQLQDGDRLGDALTAAGGHTAEADLISVNLALRVQDEDHHHIPRAGETPKAQPPSAQAPSASATAEAGKIDINEANAETLMGLPNIGESRARAIIAYREQSGGFGDPTEIMEVDGIGPGIFESVRDLISVR